MTKAPTEPGPGSRAQRVAAAMVASVPVPPVPLDRPWSYGVGDGVLRRYRLPRLAEKAVGTLNRLGQVSVSPDGFGFDGQEIPWSRIAGLECAWALDTVTDTAIDTEVKRLTQFLPGAFGLKDWAVTRLKDGLFALAYAAVEQAEQGVRSSLNEPNEPNGVNEPSELNGVNEPDRQAATAMLPVPVTIHYRGGVLRRSTEQSPGFLAALLCASVPGVSDAVLQTAARHGVEVIQAPAPRGQEYAARLRERLDRFGAKLATAPDET